MAGIVIGGNSMNTSPILSELDRQRQLFLMGVANAQKANADQEAQQNLAGANRQKMIEGAAEGDIARQRFLSQQDQQQQFHQDQQDQEAQRMQQQEEQFGQNKALQDRSLTQRDQEFQQRQDDLNDQRDARNQQAKSAQTQAALKAEQDEQNRTDNLVGNMTGHILNSDVGRRANVTPDEARTLAQRMYSKNQDLLNAPGEPQVNPETGNPTGPVSPFDEDTTPQTRMSQAQQAMDADKATQKEQAEQDRQTRISNTQANTAETVSRHAQLEQDKKDAAALKDKNSPQSKAQAFIQENADLPPDQQAVQLLKTVGTRGIPLPALTTNGATATTGNPALDAEFKMLGDADPLAMKTDQGGNPIQIPDAAKMALGRKEFEKLHGTGTGEFKASHYKAALKAQSQLAPGDTDSVFDEEQRESAGQPAPRQTPAPKAQTSLRLTPARKAAIDAARAAGKSKAEQLAAAQAIPE